LQAVNPPLPFGFPLAPRPNPAAQQFRSCSPSGLHGREPGKPIFIIILNTLFVALIVVFVSLISLLFCVFCFVCFSSHLAAAKAAKYSEACHLLKISLERGIFK